MSFDIIQEFLNLWYLLGSVEVCWNILGLLAGGVCFAAIYRVCSSPVGGE